MYLITLFSEKCDRVMMVYAALMRVVVESEGSVIFQKDSHAEAPSIEAADWAAEVYRLEKRDHLLFTGIIEVSLIVLSAGAWFGYRKLDRHLQHVDRTRSPGAQRHRSDQGADF